MVGLKLYTIVLANYDSDCNSRVQGIALGENDWTCMQKHNNKQAFIKRYYK